MGAVTTTQSETRLSTLLDEREIVTQKYEAVVAGANARPEGDRMLNEVEGEHLTMYRERLIEIDSEVEKVSTDLEATKTAIDQAKKLRRAMVGADEGVDEQGEGIVYRDFATYARDVILSKESEECSKIAQMAGGQDMVLRAKERLQMLQRTPANTLSSNVGGLSPYQYIDQIFQVIDTSRPLVANSPRTTLERGVLTYPKISQRPVVSVQASEKTEAGNQAMHVDLQTTTASTYLGGGDLSWQAINWSTPDALTLWFNLAAADYALKTEQDAAKVIIDNAFTNVISAPIAANADFATLLAAVGAGYSKVYSVSQRVADTIVMSPDRFGYIMGLTSTPQPIFVSVNGQNIGPLNIIVSRGLDAGTIIVCDLDGLLVAETAGAPVELRVVEPAIGGVEVGIIGAFEAVVVDNGAFALITSAS